MIHVSVPEQALEWFSPGLGLVVLDDKYTELSREHPCAQKSGVTFAVDGKRRQLRGTLTVASADNPAAQLVSGYKQLHSAL